MERCIICNNFMTEEEQSINPDTGDCEYICFECGVTMGDEPNYDEDVGYWEDDEYE